jgi:poly(3-hydroxybutyrate) depolymerase
MMKRLTVSVWQCSFLLLACADVTTRSSAQVDTLTTMTIIPPPVLLNKNDSVTFHTNTACDVGPNALTSSLSHSLRMTIKAPQYCIPNPVVGGRERCYYLFVPPCASGPTPLVMDMHDTSSCPLLSTSYDRWGEVAVKHCFAVFWPIGVTDPEVADNTCFNIPGGRTVKPGLLTTEPCCCKKDGAIFDNVHSEEASSDLLVVKLMIQDIFWENRIDEQSEPDQNATMDATRIYMGGHGNGCMGALGMGAVYSDMVTAVCCHAGALLTQPTATYTPIPTWIVHGKLDDVVWPQLVEETWNYYGNGDHSCSDTLTNKIGTPTTIQSGQDTNSHENCINNATVTVVSIDESGHNPFYRAFEWSPGASSTNLDRTEMAWDFCSSYSKDAIPESLIRRQSAKTVPPTGEQINEAVNGACDVGPDALTGSLSRLLRMTIKAPQYCIPNPVVGGRERCYYLFVPPCASGPTPLVMDMHGSQSCPLFSTFYDRWAETAVKHCFAVFWPIGVTDPEVADNACFNIPGGRALKSGLFVTEPCCCMKDDVPVLDSKDLAESDLLAVKNMILDIFLENRLDNQSNGNATMDATRVYMGGHSNGCMGALGMGAVYSDIVTAVCCHAGTLLTQPTATYTPIPTWIVHGKLDDMIWPQLGEETWSFYGKDLNSCLTTNTVTSMEGGGYVVQSHENCMNNATVTLVSLSQGGHNPFLHAFEWSPGAISTTIDTTEMAWEFCSLYAKEATPLGSMLSPRQATTTQRTTETPVPTNFAQKIVSPSSPPPRSPKNGGVRGGMGGGENQVT